MNKLPHPKRVQILSMLVEGSSIRSISRVVDVSINTVAKLDGSINALSVLSEGDGSGLEARLGVDF